MSIDKLGAASGIIAALRAEVGQRSERAQRKPDSRADSAVPAQARRRDAEVLRKQLAEIVKSVDVRNAEAVRKARPQMVRAILLWEFGPELREHPDWQPMLESITHTLEAQGAGHEAEFIKLIESLKR